ncbi:MULTISPECIES: molybdopterin-dependent oxidoreductase [unclassified Hyphomicrobium]|uniref:molybdopterin-containing oxidoreductase family protein n=1 Tax=unclassified Hyphomicrobium TaxID=2619925 RepID=UPI000213EB03|nr:MULTISPECIES: molybdopterin-dependent oxidoreductase [unclassified Hyphomicrobium]CCB64758.1 putative molybdopterin oxidoreductase [Hyphomicrobium sp. MC1]
MATQAIVKTTCPRDCYDACGMIVKMASDGAVSVVGDPDHDMSRGKLCGKCSIAYNGVWRSKTDRLTTPLKRVGPKGSGQFAEVSWDDAISEIAQRLQSIIATDGGQAILQTHYTGTCSLIAGLFPLRFFNRIGATEVDPDTVCNKAGHVALQLAFGESTRGFDPRTVSSSKCVLIWGANPSASAPHVHEHWVARSGVPTIVVDPIRHATAEAADIHLQLFPGTDAALAFAMLAVIKSAGKLDRDFLARHCIGWDDIEPQLDACTLSWAEATTGVPASLIEKAALLYADGPSLLWMGQGFQRQTFGGNAMRSVGLLPPATGNIGKLGAGFLYLNGWDARGVDGGYLSASHLNADPQSVSHMDLAARLESGETKALFTWNNNIAASSPEQARLRQALRREDLLQVTVDLFQTDTADYADFVLPAASFLEFDDVVMSYFTHSVSAQVAALPPLGDALPNQEIFRRLAAAMGLTDPELRETDGVIIETILSQARPGLDFKTLAAAGTMYVPEDPNVQFASHDYRTPSGKIEMTGAQFVEAGLPSAPAPLSERRPALGEYRMLSPASEWLMNSSYANDGKIARRLQMCEAWLNPSDAETIGVESGNRLQVSSKTGSIELSVGISSAVPAGVLLAPKGQWPKASASGANINVLNPGEKADLAQSCAVHSINVTLAKSQIAT